MDVGCGGGDVSLDLARLVEPGGRVVAMDFDEVKIAIARDEARAQNIVNVEFRVADIDDCGISAEFDLAYARFILTHLHSPARALVKMREAIRPGGVIVVADKAAGDFDEQDAETLLSVGSQAAVAARSSSVIATTDS